MVCGTSKASDQPAHMQSLIRLEFSMSVKQLTEYRLEFVSLKGGCTGSSESTLVKMPHCWKSIYDILASSRCTYDTLGTLKSQRKGQIQTSTTNFVFYACSAPFHARVH